MPICERMQSSISWSPWENGCVGCLQSTFVVRPAEIGFAG